MSTLRLDGFHGSDIFYKNPLFRQCEYTEGVKAMAEQAGAYWLIDAIFSYEPRLTRSGDWFFAVRLENRGDDWLLQIGDNESPFKIQQVIEFSDFPVDSFKLFIDWDGFKEKWVLMLPGEY